MTRAGQTSALAGALCLLAGAASAASPVAAAPRLEAPAAADALRVALQSKQRLVERQLNQSPAALRIRQSKHVQANKLLAQAQADHARAQAQANAGRTQAALDLLDQALRQIMAASRLVPDAALQGTLERRENAQLREALGSFQALYKNLTGRMGGKKAQTWTVKIDSGRIDAMVVQADALMAGGKQSEANLLLSTAYRAVVSTLNDVLAAETIVYDLKFDSPAEEYHHELARNLGYEELIPIALVQFNTAPQTATLAARHVQQSRSLRQVAQRQAGGGDYAAALKTIQDATEQLQRALRVAGVLVPQSAEFTR